MPHDPGYDRARGAFFTGFDRRPVAIVRAANGADVCRVIVRAREQGAELAVRSGGHSRGGYGTTEGGILLDLSAMNAIDVDADRRTVWAQTGATAGAFTRATGEHGLATGLGDTPTVGLGGITLSGGIGYFVRKHGLTIDDVLAADVVTADGEMLHVTEETHDDLFWAIRGGGGNFGVVTRLRFRLHEIDRVLGGMLMLPATPEVITRLVATAEAAPEELSLIANVLRAPPLPFIPAKSHGKPILITQMVYAGDPTAAESAIAPIRGLATPLADMIRPMHYPEIFNVPERPRPAFDAGTNMFIDSFSPSAALAILEHLETATAEFAAIQLRVLGGAMGRVPAEATAFGHRKARLMLNIAAMYTRDEERADHEAWVRTVASTLSLPGTGAAYVGFLGDDGVRGLRRAYPPATLRRLGHLKQKYDPANLFHGNTNVRPVLPNAS
jgi:FAD/FMN-containing dehydrogenase